MGRSVAASQKAQALQVEPDTVDKSYFDILTDKKTPYIRHSKYNY